MKKKPTQIDTLPTGTRVRIRARKPGKKTLSTWEGTITYISGDDSGKSYIWVLCDDGIGRVVDWRQVQPI